MTSKSKVAEVGADPGGTGAIEISQHNAIVEQKDAEIARLQGVIDDLRAGSDRKDSHIEDLAKALAKALHSAEIERDDARAQLQSKDAEIATLRAGAQKVYGDLMEANKMLAAANNPTIGVAPPARTEDLPKLGDLPNDTNQQGNVVRSSSGDTALARD